MIRILLSIGSNIEPRQEYFEMGLRGLADAGVRVLRVSRIMETAPLEGVDGGAFLNAIIEGETDLEPYELLHRLQALEHRAGRPLPPRPRGHARTLDLDILFYGDLRLQTPELTLPHPAWNQRAFITEGLQELFHADYMPGVYTMHMTLNELLVKDLEGEIASTRKCLERMTAELYDWKPQEKAMVMGRLALTVAEIPRWISVALEQGVINFGTFTHADARSGADFVKEFDANIEGARRALAAVSDDELMNGKFELKNGDKVLMSDSKLSTALSSINHMIHHRGQLSVYLRMNGIPVPSIYGPSGDENTF